MISFSVCLLKILWSGWFFGKHLSTMCRNFLPRLVLTFELKGGLYHVMFLVRFLLFFRAFSDVSQNETKYGNILDDGRLCQS